MSWYTRSGECYVPTICIPSNGHIGTTSRMLAMERAVIRAYVVEEGGLAL
jgi:hypothetical protein